ncbi:MAG: hypothetical protein ABJA67_09215 [Chthonomonadales bacterium]
MVRTINLTDEAQGQYYQIERSNPKKLKKVQKTLGLMETDIRHPGHQTHEYSSLTGPNGEKVFEAYVENRTPGAYRVFWYYGPGSAEITILSITSHP